MRVAAAYILGFAITVACGSRAAQPDAFPDWAYPPCIRAPAGAPVDDRVPLHVAGSEIQFTAAAIANSSAAPDWFPTEHTAMPRALGASHSEKFACAYCHLPDGSGRPENAKLAGLPRSYIFAQVRALHEGQRQPGKSGWPPTLLMQAAISDLTDTQILEAAEYFAQQRNLSFLRVIERSQVPAHRAGCGIYVSTAGPQELLREAILEMPADQNQFELRDPHTTYVAYVPRGSIERGRTLAATGRNGRTQPCAACHGADLRSGPDLEGPPLAGRFATYLFRQLYGFKTGTRAGDIAEPMRVVVAQLTQADMIDLAAYAASLKP
jgi:cytochrome c553